MRLFCVTLVTVALVAADLASDMAGLPEHVGRGWDVAATAALITFVWMVAIDIRNEHKAKEADRG